MNARTRAGQRLRRMLSTSPLPNGRRFPPAFDARLAERIVEELVPMIEEEAAEMPGQVIAMGERVYLRWADSVSWGVVRAIGGDGQGYTITVEREGGTAVIEAPE